MRKRKRRDDWADGARRGEGRLLLPRSHYDRQRGVTKVRNRGFCKACRLDHPAYDDGFPGSGSALKRYRTASGLPMAMRIEAGTCRRTAGANVGAHGP